MFWILLLLIYLGVTLVWVRWHLWPIFFWPLHLIVSDEDPNSTNSITFRTFSRRAIPPRFVVPFSAFGPCFIPVSILCWLYMGAMFALVRLWCALTDRWRAFAERWKKNPQAQVE